MNNFFDQPQTRDARRRERRRTVQRRRLSALAAALAVVLTVVAVVALATGGGGQDGGGTAPGSGRSGEASTPAPSSSASLGEASATGPVAAPTASPASEPTPPPLRKPTKRDPLRVYFGGDSLSGMPAVMFAQRAQKTGLMKVTIDYQESSRLTVPDPVDWPARLRAKLGARPYDVGVFLIGANDTGMPMLVDGTSRTYPSRAWQREYQDRAETLMSMMLQRGVDRVYWVGLPVMPKYGQNEAVKGLNELFEAAAARHSDVVYVDAYTPLATESGKFNAALRSGDGVHYTNEGAERIADAVWEAMRRDWRRPKPSTTQGADEASP